MRQRGNTLSKERRKELIEGINAAIKRHEKLSNDTYISFLWGLFSFCARIEDCGDNGIMLRITTVGFSNYIDAKMSSALAERKIIDNETYDYWFRYAVVEALNNLLYTHSIDKKELQSSLEVSK